MASQSKLRTPAPRRTRTIGVRLTPVEIAGLNTLLAQQPAEYSRAGFVAGLVVDALIAKGVMRADEAG